MKKENIPVIIAVALPVLVILLVALFAYLPSAGQRPSDNFVYVERSNQYYPTQGDCTVYASYYEVDDSGALRKLPYVASVLSSEKTVNPCGSYGSQEILKDAPDLYLYDSKTDSSSKISYADASSLTYFPDRTSPEGYTVDFRYARNSGIFDLFGAGDSSGVFANKKNVHVKLSVGTSEDLYYNANNFKFIGWVRK
jgi:hypothetical protein